MKETNAVEEEDTSRSSFQLDPVASNTKGGRCEEDVRMMGGLGG